MEDEKKWRLWYYCSQPAGGCESAQGDCDKCEHKAEAEDRKLRGVTGRRTGKKL